MIILNFSEFSETNSRRHSEDSALTSYSKFANDSFFMVFFFHYKRINTKIFLMCIIFFLRVTPCRNMNIKLLIMMNKKELAFSVRGGEENSRVDE